MVIRFFCILLGTALVGSPAFAEFGNSDVKRVEVMKDGSSLIVFGNGRMGMHDRWGRSMHMSAGTVMPSRDGEKIVMVSNEVSRVHALRPRGQ